MIFKGRNDEALNILSYYHAGGDVSNATVQFEYKEIKETITLEKEVLKETSYMDFFKTKGNRWRLAIVSIFEIFDCMRGVLLIRRQVISLGIISQYSGNALFSNYSNLIYEGAGITSQNQKIPVSRRIPI